MPTRVLVVDEEVLIRWSICTALTAEGYDAVPAATVKEARGSAAEWPPPRVAILDSRFARGDDDDIPALMRGVYPGCRYIIMTTDREGEAPFDDTGSRVHVIQKPFDLGAMVRLVDELSGRDGVAPAPRLDG